MSIEGEISVWIELGPTGTALTEPAMEANGGVKDVYIKSSRKTDFASFLKGKPRSKAVEILPVLFNVCGQAHAQASASACRLVPRTNEDVTAGALLVLCENAREHLLRIFTGWDLGAKPDLASVPFQDIIGLVGKMKTAVSDGAGGVQISQCDTQAGIRQIANQLDEILGQHIFNCSPKEWLGLRDDDQLARWAVSDTTVPANYINSLYQNEWQGVGCTEPNFLPALCPDELVQQMHGDQGNEFIREPDWNGTCYETGSFARNYDHPLVSVLIDRYGAGLLARQVARLVELARISEQIIGLISFECETDDSEVRLGFGQVETARGQLTHSAIFKGDEIIDYKILAPTEWNFHPRGVVCDSLKSLVNSGCADQGTLAPMIIEAIDPCVPYQVRMN